MTILHKARNTPLRRPQKAFMDRIQIYESTLHTYHSAGNIIAVLLVIFRGPDFTDVWHTLGIGRLPGPFPKFTRSCLSPDLARDLRKLPKTQLPETDEDKRQKKPHTLDK